MKSRAQITGYLGYAHRRLRSGGCETNGGRQILASMEHDCDFWSLPNPTIRYASKQEAHTHEDNPAVDD